MLTFKIFLGLDTLHGFLKNKFPNLVAPSFIVDKETKHGLRLTYKSKRKWFVYYAMGQIIEVGRESYEGLSIRSGS